MDLIGVKSARMQDVNASAVGPLAGSLVVGLEQSVAGPLATRILADLGARVVKIEPVRGDFARHWDAHAAGESAQFWWLNNRKESVVLDLQAPRDRAVLDALLDRADALVHNMSPPAVRRLGLADVAFDEAHPALINCQISGYGANTSLSDRKAYDMLIQAEAGLMSLTGHEDQPMRVGVSLCDVTTGIYAALLVLAALVDRRRTGVGRRIDLSMFDVALEMIGPMLVAYLNAGVLFARSPDRHHAIAPYGVFTCSDGQAILLAIEQDAEWRRFCEHVLQDATLGDTDRYSTNAQRVEHRAEVDAYVAKFFEQRTFEEAARNLEELSFAFAAVNDIAGVSSHPCVTENQVIRDSFTSDNSAVRALSGICERILQTAPQGRARPPAIGEDTERIRAEFASEHLTV